MQQSNLFHSVIAKAVIAEGKKKEFLKTMKFNKKKGMLPEFLV